ncbi:hypothetical protein EV175_002707 [Coemansia sp. RSA 1933]|nr:hypothetical protein EV175_002707 [Coemansia sp. RSA 1933]
MMTMTTSSLNQAIKGRESSSYMGTLGEFIDTSDAYLELVGSSRCGEVHTGKWSDGQAVVVKAAPVDNDELLHELSVEVQAYERLHDLQGTIVPRVIAHGHGNIEGKLVGILAIERIKDEEMLPAVDMDTRSTLMGLTNEERVRCTKAFDAIHDRGVAHGDVRGANLLFRRSQEGGNAPEPVFIDFGFSVFDTNAEAFQDTKMGDTYQLCDAFLGYCPYN